MKRLAVVFFIAITIGHGTITYAQDSLVGTYTGSYRFAGRGTGMPRELGIKLIITSVENGVVKGTATNYSGGPCSGDYPMAGNYDGNKLVMKATAKGGRAGDCSFALDVAQEGNKLEGKTGSGQPLHLSK